MPIHTQVHSPDLSVEELERWRANPNAVEARIYRCVCMWVVCMSTYALQQQQEKAQGKGSSRRASFVHFLLRTKTDTGTAKKKKLSKQTTVGRLLRSRMGMDTAKQKGSDESDQSPGSQLNVAEVEKIFNQYSGKELNEDEFCEVLGRILPNTPQATVQTLFKKMDVDNSQTVTWDEFVDYMTEEYPNEKKATDKMPCAPDKPAEAQRWDSFGPAAGTGSTACAIRISDLHTIFVIIIW